LPQLAHRLGPLVAIESLFQLLRSGGLERGQFPLDELFSPLVLLLIQSRRKLRCPSLVELLDVERSAETLSELLDICLELLPFRDVLDSPGEILNQEGQSPVHFLGIVHRLKGLTGISQFF
jgi:hypothetical protein